VAFWLSTCIWLASGYTFLMNAETLKPRSLKILQSLVRHYIRDGQPVGSGALARDAEIVVSSATIRHIMADLEQRGYLRSPHTSAGRVPTTQGYRLFIDHFISVQQPAIAEVEKMRGSLEGDHDAKSLVAKASSLLSGITQLTGIVTLPVQEKLVLRQVEFLPLSESRVLVVLVFNDHQVYNRIIHTKRNFSRRELELAGNFISEKFAQQDLLTVRLSLFDQIKQDRVDLEAMLNTVMDFAQQAKEQQQTKDYVIQGQANLFAIEDDQSVENLKSLFAAFTEKNDILHLLDQSMAAQDIRILVGEESGYDVLENYSLVTAPYYSQGDVVGVLGVIGPRRMQYDKVISTVDITAKLLSSAFNLVDSAE
jgi:heat-inducible transcriptional repressor